MLAEWLVWNLAVSWVEGLVVEKVVNSGVVKADGSAAQWAFYWAAQLGGKWVGSSAA